MGRLRLPFALCLVAVAVAAAACGDDPERTGEDAVLDAANAWGRAALSGDGEATCALMTPAGGRAATDPYDGIAPERPPIASTCEAAIEITARDDGALASEAEFVNARVSGPAAVAEDEAGWCLTLRMDDGEWLVAGLPLPGGEDTEVTGGEPCGTP